jgi:hypothetical protein
VADMVRIYRTYSNRSHGWILRLMNCAAVNEVEQHSHRLPVSPRDLDLQSEMRKDRW